MITVFGSINVDLVTRVPVLPRPGETVLAPAYKLHFGGKGANQAVSAARAVGRPGIIRMVGAVGNDAFGRDSADNLARFGVDVAGLARVDAPTGCAFIQVDDSGENVITVASGANLLLTSDALRGTRFASGDVLVLQMEIPLAEVTAAATLAHAGGAEVIANLAPVPQGLTADQLRDLARLTTFLVVNEHEADVAAACLGNGRGDAVDCALAVARDTGCTVIATLGADGACAAEPDGNLLRVASPAITPVDTTGAGDTFVGVFAAFRAEGVGLRNAMSLACRAASLACLSLGAQSAMPDRAAIMA